MGWLDGPNIRSCKIGTIPAIVRVHGKDILLIKVGQMIRVQERENGPWLTVTVTSVSDNHFFADR